MTLLWLAIGATCFFGLLAGWQGERMLRERGGAINRLEMRLGELEKKADLLRREGEAKDILLREAHDWMKAQQAKLPRL